ncbi:MAG: site-specific DNA-methyltransferase [Candidatus Nephrothrix sp. EaCA]|nr:MAG: site-specific DNA-methyltransferase [Candidatus Nephrothrix sp. EaCA]
MYEDDFAESAEAFLKRSNQKSEDGVRLVANTESNGRFHSDWLSMMYSRLKLARNLLRDDGVIFISIDDNEVHSLRKLCDEIFGASSFEGVIVPIVNPGGRDYKQIAVTHEYVLVYSKSNASELYEMPKDIQFEKEDSLGGYEYRELRNRNPKFHSGNRPNLFYPFYVAQSISKDDYCSVSLEKDSKHTIEVRPYNSSGKESVWRWGKNKATNNIKLGNLDASQIHAKQKSNGEWNIYEKNRRATTKVKSIWSEPGMRTEDGTRLIRSIFGKSVFDHPKSLELVKRCVQIGSSDNDIVMDFFAGSGTLPHAVLQLNSEDGGNRKFIAVQLPEPCAPNTEAFEAGYSDIASVSKDRIKFVGKLISDQSCHEKWCRDFGFRVLKIDTSNMADVYYAPDALNKDTLNLFLNNIKPDRTPEDLLFQVMLDWGVDLSLPIARQTIQGKEVFFVDNGALAACFDSHGGIDEAFVKELAKRQALRVVFRDASFKDSAVKISVKQIFKLLSPSTEVKCI